MSKHAYIIGVGMTPFGRHLDRTHTDLAQEAVRLALADADIEAKEIDSTVYATVVQGFFAGEMSIPSQFALRPLGISGVRTLSVEAACASSTIGLHQAVQQIVAGVSDVALAVGVEKLFTRDREKKFAVFQQPLDIAVAHKYIEDTKALLEPAPEGFDQPGPNALMDAYAAQARLHMKTYGTTQAQIAAVASKNHMHSVHNPLSQYREPLTVEEILAAPNVSWPLTVPMCAPISDGASAAVVVSEAIARRIGLSRAVRIRACDSLTGQDRAPDDYANHVTRIASRKVFGQAGLGPQDCDLAEVHDASSIGEMLQVEAVGLCPPGGRGFRRGGGRAFAGRADSRERVGRARFQRASAGRDGDWPDTRTCHPASRRGRGAAGQRRAHRCRRELGWLLRCRGRNVGRDRARKGVIDSIPLTTLYAAAAGFSLFEWHRARKHARTYLDNAEAHAAHLVMNGAMAVMAAPVYGTVAERILFWILAIGTIVLLMRMALSIWRRDSRATGSAAYHALAMGAMVYAIVLMPAGLMVLQNGIVVCGDGEGGIMPKPWQVTALGCVFALDALATTVGVLFFPLRVLAADSVGAISVSRSARTRTLRLGAIPHVIMDVGMAAMLL